VLIANNTFGFAQGGGQAGQIMLWNSQTNLTIQNNIFYQPKSYAITRYSSTVSACTLDHNLVYGASGMISDSSGCALGVTQTGADPAFVNSTVAPYDFHLQAGSPAIGSGIQLPAVVNDLTGLVRASTTATADLGAYQFAPTAALQIVNTTSGAANWTVGDGWAVTITGGRPQGQVAVAVGGWSAVLGYADGAGNFSISGQAYPGNVGTTYELWSVAGSLANSNPVTVVVLP